MSATSASEASRLSQASGNADLAAPAPQRLEGVGAESEAFTAAVAHELRTPLSAMESFCTLLQQSLADIPDHPSRRSSQSYADRLHAGIRQMGEQVEALTRLSRASAADLKIEDVDLSALARELLDALLARHPGVTHDLSVQAGLLVRGDRALLRVLLENLLGNAWKFSAGQPVVRIAFGREPGEGGAYFVRDHGVGFDMAQASRLFQPFERLHAHAAFAGTGVGLATVRRIVGRHAGQVRAVGRPGEGATFYFSLGAAP